MYGDTMKPKERVGKKSSAVHKAMQNIINKKYAKQGMKEAHKKEKSK